MTPPRSPKARAALSLKGRALALLAQREQSRVELRRKLLRHARVEEARAAEAAAIDAAAEAAEAAKAAEAAEAAETDASGGPGQPSAAARVEALLDWLEAHRYLSAERFEEARVHARAPRFGNLRIRMEFAQHGLTLSPEAGQALAASEFERARSVRERKFGSAAPADAAERARQARFLGARGFTAEVVRRVLRATDDTG